MNGLLTDPGIQLRENWSHSSHSLFLAGFLFVPNVTGFQHAYYKHTEICRDFIGPSVWAAVERVGVSTLAPYKPYTRSKAILNFPTESMAQASGGS